MGNRDAVSARFCRIFYTGALDRFRATITASSSAVAPRARRSGGLGWPRLRPVGSATGLPTERERPGEHLERMFQNERPPHRSAFNLRAVPQTGPRPMPMDTLHARESRTAERLSVRTCDDRRGRHCLAGSDQAGPDSGMSARRKISIAKSVKSLCASRAAAAWLPMAPSATDSLKIGLRASWPNAIRLR